MARSGGSRGRRLGRAPRRTISARRFPEIASGWVLWTPLKGYFALSDDDFERDYKMDIGPSVLETDAAT